MKSLKKVIVVVVLFIISNGLLAQNEYKNWLSVLADVPKVFESWITGTEKIASAQDRDNFIDISKDIYRSLDRVIIAKRGIIRTIETSSNANYQNAIQDCIDRVQYLQASLDKSEDLCKKIGLDAINFSSTLSFSFAKKEFMLSQIIDNPDKKAKALENLNKGVTLLEEAKTKIDEFIVKLEKK
jgi:hypothetical protein